MIKYKLDVPPNNTTLLKTIEVSDMGEVWLEYHQDMCITQIDTHRLGPMLRGNEIPMGRRIRLQIGPMP